MLWEELLTVVLDFHIRVYEQFLLRVNQLFAQVDADSDGVIDEQQFREFVGSLQAEAHCFPSADYERHQERLLEVVDPHCNQRITSSQVVALLTSELTVNGD